MAEYWLVQYTVAQNSVPSRLDPTGGTAGTAIEYLVIAAASSSAASSAAQRQLGSRASSIGLVTGPYATKAAATAAEKSASKKLDKATQAGALPDLGTEFGALLDIPKYIAAATIWIANRGNWLRILKVIAGGALIVMGAHQLTVVKNGINTAKQVGKKAVEVAGVAALG